MIKRLLFSTLYLFIITLVIGFIHYNIVKNIPLFIPLQNIYIFNLIMAVVGLAILYFIKNKLGDKVGFTFLGIGIIKMALSVSFLMPLIESNFKDKILIRPFNIYFHVTLSENEMKKYDFDGVNE